MSLLTKEFLEIKTARRECYEIIQKLGSGRNSSRLEEIVNELHEVHNVADFDNMMTSLSNLLDTVDKFYDPLSEPSDKHTISLYATAMYKLIKTAYEIVHKSLTDISNDTAMDAFTMHCMDTDGMIINTIDRYQRHIDLYEHVENMSVDCHDITRTYIDSISSLIYIKSRSDSKSAAVYKLIAVYYPKFYEASWEFVLSEIDYKIIALNTTTNPIVRIQKSSLPSLTTYPKDADKQITGSFVTSRGYGEWVIDHYRQKISNMITPNHKSRIPEDQLLWLEKSDIIRNCILLPDKDTGELYVVCKYGDTPYVLFINPELYSSVDEHFIISGLDILNPESPDPNPIRRELRLNVPRKIKYEYVPDEI